MPVPPRLLPGGGFSGPDDGSIGQQARATRLVSGSRTPASLAATRTASVSGVSVRRLRIRAFWPLAGHPSSIVGHRRLVQHGHGHLGKRLHPRPSGWSVVTEARVPHDS